MQFGFSKDDLTEARPKQMELGIQENVKLTRIVYEPLSDGNATMVLGFYFENKEGQYFRFVEYSIDEAPSATNEWKFKNQNERILHILGTFMPREEIIDKVGQQDSFVGFANKLVEIMGDIFKDQLLRVKVVNKNNFPTLPNRAIRPFIQLMSEPNKLAVNPKYDNIEYSQPDEDSNSSDSDAWNSTTADSDVTTVEGTPEEAPW